MRKPDAMIALVVTPAGAWGINVTSGRSGEYSIARRESVTWERSMSPASRAEDLARLVGELRGGSSMAPRGLVALHSSWIYCERVPVPPASRSEVESALGLAVSRRWPSKEGAEVRWSWQAIETDGSERTALLGVVHREILEPIEEAFARHKISLQQVVPLPVAVAHLNEDADYYLSAEDALGVSLSEFRGGRLALCSFVPSQAGTDSQRLLDFLLPDDAEKVYVASDDDRAPVLNGSRGAVAIDAEKKLKQLIPAGDWSKCSVAEKAMGGLVALAATRRVETINFAPEKQRRLPGLLSLQPQLSMARLAAWTVVLALLLLIAASVRSELEKRWHKQAKEAAVYAQVDESAGETNIGVLTKVAREQKPLLDALVALKESKPDGVMLESFEFDARGNVTIGGQTSGVSVVQQFTANLNKSKYFTQATTQSTKFADKKVKFTIRCKLRNR